MELLDRPPVDLFAELKEPLEWEARAGMSLEPERAEKGLAAAGAGPRAGRVSGDLVD